MRRTFYILGGLLLALAILGCGPRAETGNNTLDERFAPLCQPCETHESCGTEDDYCLQNQGTGEAFCGVACEEGDCPDGYVCTEVGTTGIDQCAPLESTCAGLRDPCDGACSSDQVCVQEECVDAGDWGEEQTFCVDYVNQLRASVDEPALERSGDLENCATAAAIEDARTGEPHGRFLRTNGCGYQAFAETEVPGWSLARYETVERVISQSADVMFSEGPGGGHYEIITGDYTKMGCGIHVTEDDAVWVVHNFR
ncbi:MAG: CAP domain-containing protein [Myxococcota bacterium]